MKYLPWLLSAITIYMTVLAGNKHRYAWAVGLGNQALWLGWIVATATWGFLPMNIALWVVYGRNHMKWSAAQPSNNDGASGSPSSYRARPDGQDLNPDLSASASPATKEQQ